MNRSPSAVLALILAGLFVTSSATAQSLEVRQNLREGRAHVPEQLLVQFRANADDAQQAQVLGRLNANRIEALVRRANRSDSKGDLVLVKVPRGKAIADAMTMLEADGRVEFAEPNWLYQTQQVANPNDPNVGNLWGMMGATTSPANPYGSGALAAWNAGRLCNAAVHVGVIDEGLMITHNDLKANVWVNALDSTINKRDDDRNAYIDANNGTGVFGVCPTAKLISAKFLGSLGGSTANAILAVDYITNLKKAQKLRIVATNNSWGGGGFSQGLYDAINRANTENILFIAAAGNSNINMDVSNQYPAGYALPNVIAVAAIDSAGNRASFSNYGGTKVHIAAPGVNILSTLPGSSNTSTYNYYSGTSMASPHVAGAAALYASLNPCATAAQVKSAILAHATSTAQLTGLVIGARRLNVASFTSELTCP
jgi:subtilisin family serine protease